MSEWVGGCRGRNLVESCTATMPNNPLPTNLPNAVLQYLAQLPVVSAPLPLEIQAMLYRAAVALFLPPPGCEPSTPAAVVECANSGAAQVQRLMAPHSHLIQEAASGVLIDSSTGDGSVAPHMRACACTRFNILIFSFTFRGLPVESFRAHPKQLRRTSAQPDVRYDPATK